MHGNFCLCTMPIVINGKSDNMSATSNQINNCTHTLSLYLSPSRWPLHEDDANGCHQTTNGRKRIAELQWCPSTLTLLLFAALWAVLRQRDLSSEVEPCLAWLCFCLCLVRRRRSTINLVWCIGVDSEGCQQTEALGFQMQ